MSSRPKWLSWRIPSFPVLATLSFQTADKGGRTVMGSSAAEAAKSLAEAGAIAVGVNCGDVDPHEASVIIGMMKDDDTNIGTT